MQTSWHVHTPINAFSFCSDRKGGEGYLIRQV